MVRSRSRAGRATTGRRPPRPPSPLESALLSLLRQAPQSGYDLRKVFADTPFVHFSDSPGAVYPALRALEQRGLVTARAAAKVARAPGASPGRRRRPLALTAAGREALRRWLRQPVTRDDLAQPINTPMLRFAFMEEVLGREACVAFLEQYETALTAYITELAAYRDANLGAAPLAGRLAFDNGVATFQAQLAWVRQARHAFRQEAP
jgi:DNA-binding PadR family transcriptional regulator